jgi:hypothetical protein
VSPTPTPIETVTPEPSPEPEQPQVIPATAEELVAQFDGEPITFEAMLESGLDYEDLPPDTPIMLENGVVLTAEVADALEVFDNPTEILGAIFTNPAKALTAVSNIGADMTPENREKSQEVVVSAIVVSQIAQVRRTK